MPASVLAAGTAAADSSDLVVTDPVTVCLKDAAGASVPGGAIIKVQLKDDAGAYFDIGVLSSEQPAQVITGPGTYRFSRLAGGPSAGVFSG